MTAKRRRTSLGLFRNPAVTLTRTAMRKDEIVYVLVADKKHAYKLGRSRVVYVGMTEAGVERISKSAADRASTILTKKGFQSFDVRVVHYKPPKTFSARVWKKRPVLLLERAFLIAFRELFGEVPLCNNTGHNMRPTFGEFDRFSRKRIETLLEDLS